MCSANFLHEPDVALNRQLRNTNAWMNYLMINCRLPASCHLVEHWENTNRWGKADHSSLAQTKLSTLKKCALIVTNSELCPFNSMTALRQWHRSNIKRSTSLLQIRICGKIQTCWPVFFLGWWTLAHISLLDNEGTVQCHDMNDDCLLTLLVAMWNPRQQTKTNLGQIATCEKKETSFIS